MKKKMITSIDAALRIYYTHPEIGNKEITELFGEMSSSTISNYKKEAIKVQLEEGVRTACFNTVNTAVAYRVWGIDIADLEKRRTKLKKLGLCG